MKESTEYELGDLVVCISVKSKKPTLGWIVEKANKYYHIEWQDFTRDGYAYSDDDIKIFKSLLRAYGT